MIAPFFRCGKKPCSASDSYHQKAIQQIEFMAYLSQKMRIIASYFHEICYEENLIFWLYKAKIEIYFL